jgi:hypothetical protein
VQGKAGTPNYKIKDIVLRPESEWHRIENTHEAIIKRHHFDLAQKILRLYTRTAPKGDKVYLFSGILICGCCGNRMTRKTVPYKGVKYHYYWCPTGKKNGCNGSVMLKECELTDCVLANVKAHITNVASLETLVAGLDSTRFARELSENLKGQIAENERRLEKIRLYKAGLYENMMNGNLSREEHKSLIAVSRALPLSLRLLSLFFSAASRSSAISFAALPVIRAATSTPSKLNRTICSAASPEWFMLRHLLYLGFFICLRPVEFVFHPRRTPLNIFTQPHLPA